MIAAEGPGWLVTSVPWYPGWSASIDGQSAVAEAVDGALVGMELPTGTHTVRISYRPAGLELGTLISISSVLTLAAVASVSLGSKRVATLLGRPSPGAEREESK